MFRPLNDNVLIERSNADTVSKGGILIPDNIQEKPLQGVVIGVGTGTRTRDGDLIPLNVTVGDTVLFGRSGTEVKIDGQTYVMTKESNIYGVLD